MVERGPTLRGKLTLDNRPFRKSLRRSRRQSKTTFDAIAKSSRRLSGVFAGLGTAFAGIFAVRAFSGLIRAGEGIENTKISLEGLLGSSEKAERAFTEIDGLATDVKQTVGELSRAFLTLETAQLGSIKNLELVADAATVFNRDTNDVALALRSLETETLRNAFGFDQVSTAAGNFSASLNGVVVAQSNTRAGFRQSILDFIETSRFAGAARKASDSFGSGLSTISNTLAQVGLALREAFGPALREIAVSFKEQGLQLRDFIVQNREAFSEELLGRVRSLVKVLRGLKERFDELRVRISLVGQFFGQLNDAAERLRQRVSQVGMVLRVLFPSFAALGKVLNLPIDAIERFNAETNEWVASMAQANREQTKLALTTQQTTSALDSSTSSYTKISGATKTAGTSLRALNDDLQSTQSELMETTAAAQQTAGAFGEIGQASSSISAGGGGGSGRSGRRSLGSVVRGDPNDPTNIRAAITRLESQARGVQSSITGGIGAPFKSINLRNIRNEIDRLQAELVAANQRQTSSIVEAIINANAGLTSEELTQRIREEIALRQRFGLLGGQGSSAGFEPSQGLRF